MKNLVTIFGAAIIVSAGVMYKNPFGKVNAYPIPIRQAYVVLSKMNTDVNSGILISKDMTISGNGASELYLEAGDTRFCTVILTPDKENSTEINVSCENYGEGAAAGLTGSMRRNGLIELVDSTLRDRPYDKQLARGSSASGWPDDPVKHGNMLDAQAKALEMDAETRRLGDSQ